MDTKWITAIKNNNGDIFNLNDLSKFITHEGENYSCPFIYKHNNTNYIFFVDNGIIKYCSISKDMKVSPPTTALNQPYDLSSPCIFEYKEEVYMIPESAKGNLQIYKSTDFPYKWELYKEIGQNIKIYNPIIYKHKETWFLFSTIQTYRNANYETEGVQGVGTSADDGLLILYSENPINQWSIHPECKEGFVYYPESQNAGNIFTLGDKLIRPIQQSNPIRPESGYSIGFKEININKEKYTEKTLDRSILPNWYEGLSGTRTFNFNEDFIVIDGRLGSSTNDEKIFKGIDQHFVNYWFPRNKNYKTKNSIEKRLKNIKILSSTFKKHNIDIGLAFGTLLGAFRDKSLIPHDHDDDFYILEKNKELFTKDLFLDLKKQGMHIMRIVDNDRTISFYREGYYMDLLFVAKNNKGNYHFFLDNKEVEVANYHFEKFDTITLNNGKYNILNKTEEFLEKTYGDWKTPVMTHGWVNGKFSSIN